jgi:regulator of cell morphogenesis and NO signaling
MRFQKLKIKRRLSEITLRFIRTPSKDILTKRRVIKYFAHYAKEHANKRKAIFVLRKTHPATYSQFLFVYLCKNKISYNMYKIAKYVATDLMSDLISENYIMLNILSRFAMPLGVEDKTIAEFCEENNVEINTFLQIVNMSIDDTKEKIVNPKLSFGAILLYLTNSHKYFIDFRLPLIRKELINAIKDETNTANVIIKYFDEYFVEVKKHMDYEERKVFPYISSLINKETSGKYNIKIFSSKHDKIDVKLAELKDIIIKYYKGKNSYELNNVLFNIFLCADDLRLHNEIEDRLLVPTITEIERKMKNHE